MKYFPLLLAACAHVEPVVGPFPSLPVKSTADFAVTGDGANAAWNRTEWVALNRRNEGLPYETRFKVLYSKKGIYVLMDGADKKVTSSMRRDNAHLWEEDVYEAFFWTDEAYPIYFEYEISPLNFELPILVPNVGGRFRGWLPWDYEGPRKIQKATSTRGGPKETGASVEGWTAEFFIPFELFVPLDRVPPKSGDRWRANFYRMDYDDGKKTSWDWARVGPSFHEYKKYGVLVFE